MVILCRREQEWRLFSGGSESGVSLWVRARVVPLIGMEQWRCLFLGRSKSDATFGREQEWFIFLKKSKSAPSFWEDERVLPLFGREQEWCLFLGGRKSGDSF